MTYRTIAVICLLLNSFLTCSGIKCFECKDVPHPSVCDQVTECTQQSNCLLREYVTSSGNVLFSSSCISQQKCSHMHKRSTDVADTGLDVDICLECCNNTDYCNQQGCGTKAPDRHLRGPYCFKCSVENDVHGCRNIRMCDVGHSCWIEESTFPGMYRSGCKPETECDTLNANRYTSTFTGTTWNSSISLPYCCKNDFCNDILTFYSNPTNSPTNSPNNSPTNSPSTTQILYTVSTYFPKATHSNINLGGTWSTWGPWSPCSRSCGDDGQMSRIRTCVYPHGNTAGPACPGNVSEQMNCSLPNCPATSSNTNLGGTWSPWGPWSPCSRSCDQDGHMSRIRTCVYPHGNTAGTPCPGNISEQITCSLPQCPTTQSNTNLGGIWSPWSPWSSCSRSCGGGEQMSRLRTCVYPHDNTAGTPCPGNTSEQISCPVPKCPINGAWSNWEAWSDCDQTCGAGHKSRHRKCDNPAPLFNGSDCPGHSHHWHRCNELACPVDGGWSDWGPWLACSVTCDHGMMPRYRHCNNPPPQYNGAPCVGNDHQFLACNHGDCPAVGGWSEWGHWSRCDVTCGKGMISRARTCTAHPNTHEAHCPGKAILHHRCLYPDCPGSRDKCGTLGKNGFSVVANHNRHMCVTLVEVVANWADAKTHCKHQGGDLVTIRSEDMDKSIELMIKTNLKAGQGSAWIGLKANTNHEWHWLDTTVSFHQSNQHHMDLTQHHCASAQSENQTYNWSPTACPQQLPYLCEFE